MSKRTDPRIVHVASELDVPLGPEAVNDGNLEYILDVIDAVDYANEQCGILTADSPEPAVGSVVRMVGAWRAPDATAVAQHWSEEGWYVAGSDRFYDWPHLFVGWDRVALLHDGRQS
jgi:hypothetical protein